MSSTRLPLRSRAARAVNALPLGKPLVRIARSFFGVGGEEDQWQRIVLNQTTKKIVAELGPSQLSALEISGRRWEQTAFKQYKSVEYPEFDVCGPPLDERFDLIICEQVFEHLLWPYRAGRNVYEMLKPGGRFLISTPFLIKVHECPHDCTRWTPTGMKYFLAECGFDLDSIESDSWGNRKCVRANLPRWQIYQRWRHSLKNDDEFPVQVWAVAQKGR